MRNINLIKSLAAAVSTAVRKSSGSIITASAVAGDSSAALSAQLLSSLDRTGPKLPHDPANNSAEEVSSLISSILQDEGDNEEYQSTSFYTTPKSNDKNLVNNLLDIEFTSQNTNQTLNPNSRQKEISRERKKKYIFKHTESRRFTKLMKTCASKIGTNETLDFFDKLGRETGLKEYNSLIKHCINNARLFKNNEDQFSENVQKVFRVLGMMREKGFSIEEASFGPILLLFIDFEMEGDFEELSDLIKEENPRVLGRLGFYEMLLSIRVSDEARIQELCGSVETAGDDVRYTLAESYLLAFCESDRKKELSQLLEFLEINEVSKPKYVTIIFKSLGRLELEHFAEKFLSEIHKSGGENFTSLIYEYVTSLPNLTAKEMVVKFTYLHEKFETVPPLEYYNNFISYFCNLSKINEALEIIDHMNESGFEVSTDLFNQIIHTCDQSFELHLVHDIYSMMRKINLKPNGEIFKTLISLCVKMRDFEGAYEFLERAKENGEILTSMYNSIMAGYFREKNSQNVKKVMKEMRKEGLKPDGDTFSYLIALSDSEKDISKYWEELQKEEIRISKSIFIGLIHAYSKLGNFDMVKQVVNHPDAPVKYMTEIKSTLTSALASNGKISDALEIYDEIKNNGSSLDQKALMSLIENTKTEGELEKMTNYLNELKGSNYWYDGCCRVILYCVQHNYTDDAIAFLKQLKEKDETSAYMGVDQIFCHVRNMEPVKLETGMRLLHAIKEELGFQISRTSLDFLLSMCVKAKDSHTARIIYNEYKLADLPYNVLTKLRMYQALMAVGETKVANEMLGNIQHEDKEVRYLIQSIKQTYFIRNEKKKKSINKSKKKKNK
ncbi:hypothetical protein LUZ60_007439 [Juncus effusus]|nr:hypothetical protein LUZ60_007439 [Juncus effusus]